MKTPWTIEVVFRDSAKLVLPHEAQAAGEAEVRDEILKSGLIEGDGQAVYVNLSEVKTLCVKKGSGRFLKTHQKLVHGAQPLT